MPTTASFTRRTAFEELSFDDGILRARLIGPDLDERAAHALVAELDEACDGLGRSVGTILLDFTDVQTVSMWAADLLRSAHVRSRAARAKLVVLGLRSELRDVLRLARLERRVRVIEDEAELARRPLPEPIIHRMGLEAALPVDNILTTQLNRVMNWARRSAVWPMPFATACCGIELMATASSRYDLARFGAEVFRFSPRQADLLIVAGRVAVKMLPVLQRIYVQMCEPKWVISMGACASTGGVFDTYAVVQGVDQYIPVDVYVPGCPPRPEMLIEGVMAIQRIIDQDNIPTDGNGKRVPLQIAVQPNYEPLAQPVDVSVGAT